jgi:tripartite-type tricarboxylate transporter receptor subunit TctC
MVEVMGRGKFLMALVSTVALTAAPSHAQTKPPFYQGKQITIVVGFSTGGTYDAIARLIARHLGKHLPGNPTVIVRNMPGSGSMVATLNLYNAAPKDGTVLASVSGGTVIEPLLGNPQAKYDSRRLNWIGGSTKDNMVCATWHKVPVKSMADVIKRETVVGATGPGSRTLTHPRAFNELLGTRFKVVSGYPGGNDITLAMERGEVEGYCGWAIGSIMSRAPHWLTDGTITLLNQFTGELPKVPIARDMMPTELGRKVMDFLSADAVLAWPLVAPPGLPEARVAELRAAYLAAMKDPELKAEADKLKLEVAPVPGTEMQDLVDQLYAAPADVIELVKKINSAQ